MKFGVYAEKWLAAKKGCVKDSTYYLYHYSLGKYIDEHLGHVHLRMIDNRRLEKLARSWLTEQSSRTQGLSRGTVRNLLVLVGQILGEAMKERKIKPFKISVGVLPAVRKDRCKTISRECQQQLVDGAVEDGSAKAVGVVLAAATGMREGEVCGLQWKDVNLEEGVLKVCQTVYRHYVEGGVHRTAVSVGEPKTSSSERILPIPDGLLEIMRKMPRGNGDEFVISGRTKPVEPRELCRFHKKLCETLGVPAHRFHALRHTFATECIAKGADCKVVSETLGHSSVRMTLDLYTHPNMEQKRKCVNSLGLFKNKEKNSALE